MFQGEKQQHLISVLKATGRPFKSLIPLTQENSNKENEGGILKEMSLICFLITDRTSEKLLEKTWGFSPLPEVPLCSAGLFPCVCGMRVLSHPHLNAFRQTTDSTCAPLQCSRSSTTTCLA